MLSKLAACALAAVASAQTTVKVGAVLQPTGVGSYGKVAYDAWAAWVSAQSALDYDVSISYKNYTEATLADDIASFTAASSSEKVDVLVLPYTSGASSTALGHVDSTFTGPVMVWGGASDSIFAVDGPCDGKTFKCFGFFTVGSEYMATGLTALSDQASAPLKVLLVENNNGFSRSVCSGAVSLLENLANAALTEKVSLSTYQNEPTATEMTDIVTKAADADVVGICGHNGDVEPVIKKLGEMETPPKAILSTNALTSGGISAIGSKAECVMMPTQWAEADVQDTIVGWNTADFKAAAGAAATYHGAAAAASAIIISHAMAADSNVANLAATIDGLSEVATFYGPVDFTSTGAIKKPMYTEQLHGDVTKIVAPAAAKAADMKYPLSNCPAWSGTTNTNASTASTTSAATDSPNVTEAATTTKEVVAGCQKTSALLGLIIAAAVASLRE